MRYIKYVLAVLASLLMSASLLSVSSIPAQAAQPNLRIIQANLDGGPSQIAVDQANQQNAKIMTLQELCRTELDYLQTLGWKSGGSFIVTKPKGCANGSDKGQAVLYKDSAVSNRPNEKQVKLFNPGDNDGLGPNRGNTNRSAFALTCLGDINGLIGPDLFVCTTHLYTNPPKGTNGKAVRNTQMNQVEKVLLPWAGRARKVIFTGDLNMKPGVNSLDQVYGRYADLGGRDGSRPNWTTSSRKIDYIFADKSPSLAGKGLGLVPNPNSTHKVLRGSITFR